MAFLVYPITSETFPRTGLIDVPCLSTASYDGHTAVLQPKGISVPLDFSALTPEEFQKATDKPGRDVQLQGLAALETRWLQEVPEVTWHPPYQKPLGARVEGRWYYVTPLCPDIMLESREHTVVGLFG
ncbi:hypothetical protein [Deinococcus sp. QL22]|uniref:hypothetical protein n=1 Tax=Deinococcus sp. QL22 TaxID=2939437 RepID=UPI0020183A99|nr:hypothetical protein [Deinococcus sp. QL22]UQN04830.1 hypothetical protein M1R55_07800 [Deinococcus sp. QL22]